MLVKYHNKATGNWEKKKKPQKAEVFSLTSGKSAFRQSWILILESKSSTLCDNVYDVKSQHAQSNETLPQQRRAHTAEQQDWWGFKPKLLQICLEILPPGLLSA